MKKRKSPAMGEVRKMTISAMMCAMTVAMLAVASFLGDLDLTILMVASLCMVLLGATYPDATVPCVISLIVETVWFSLMTRFTNRLWPEETR